MTTPMNQQTRRPEGIVRQTVIEDIDQYLVDGMLVFDPNGERSAT